MTSKLLFVAGIAGGLAAALALAALFSGAATAQMMAQHAQNNMTHSGWSKHSMFSASGMSMVQDVRITGIEITGDNEVTVNLAYSGNTTAPSITLVAMTNHMQMAGGMMAYGHGGMMGHDSMGMMYGPHMEGGSAQMISNQTAGMPAWNSTQWQGQMGGMYAHAEPQFGSTLVESGWQEQDPVTIVLDGDATAYEASDIHVMVFPHLT